MEGQLQLSSDAIEQIARRVVALLEEVEPRLAPRYVDAATLAAELSVERDWVYAHAEELGAIRLGGPKGRLRFDLVAIRQSMAAGEPAPPQQASPRLVQVRSGSAGRNQSRSKIGSAQMQRRAGVGAPARSPKQHQTGGSPE